MNKEVSPAIAYTIIFCLVGGLLGIVVMWVARIHWLVIPVLAAVGAILGLVIGDRARKRDQ